MQMSPVRSEIGPAWIWHHMQIWSICLRAKIIPQYDSNAAACIYRIQTLPAYFWEAQREGGREEARVWQMGVRGEWPKSNKQEQSQYMRKTIVAQKKKSETMLKQELQTQIFDKQNTYSPCKVKVGGAMPEAFRSRDSLHEFSFSKENAN